MKQIVAILGVGLLLVGCTSSGGSADKPQSAKGPSAEVDPHQSIRSFFESCQPDASNVDSDTVETVRQALAPCMDSTGLQQISGMGGHKDQQEFLKSRSGRFLATKSESGPKDKAVNVTTCFEQSGKNFSTQFVLSSTENDAKIKEIGREVTDCAPDMLMEDVS